MFDPFDPFYIPPPPATWPDTVDDVASKIERAARRKDMKAAFKSLAVMDMLDEETAAWFRERGIDLFLGSNSNEKEQVETTNYASVDSAVPAGWDDVAVAASDVSFDIGAYNPECSLI